MNVAGRSFQVCGEPLVVLHVPRAPQLLQVVVALEFDEQILGRLAEQVHQHVEPAPMRHPDDGLLDAGAPSQLHELVEQGNQAVATLEREALLTDILGMQVALQALGRRQLPEDVLLLLGAEAVLDPLRLEIILQPQSFLGVRYVREFRADGVAVDELEGCENVLQLAARRQRRRSAAREEFGLHVRVRQAEVLGIEDVGHAARRQAQGIEVRNQVSAVRVDLDQARHGGLLGARGAGGFAAGGRWCSGGGPLQLRREALADLPVGSRGTGGRRALREAREVACPARLDGGGVFQKLLVQILDKIGVSTIQGRGGELIGQ